MLQEVWGVPFLLLGENMSFFNMISFKIRKLIRGLVFDYCINKYKTCDVCFVWKEAKGYVRWETLGAAGIVGVNEKPERLIRSLVGQNVLQLCGVPKDEESVPLVCLVPFLSVIGAFGLKKFIELIRKWKGKSVIKINKGEFTVVKYKVFGLGNVK